MPCLPNSLVDLAQGAHAWVVATRDLAPVASARLRALLDASETDRMHRLRDQRDRDGYVVAHALRRVALARALGTSPRTIEFTHSPGGQPSLATPATHRLHMSLSRTRGPAGFRGVAAFSLSTNGPVGLDVETEISNVSDYDLLNQFIAPASSTRAMTPSHFTRQWTALEAFWKLRGTGLPASGCKVRFCKRRFDLLEARHPQDPHDQRAVLVRIHRAPGNSWLALASREAEVQITSLDLAELLECISN